MEITPKLKSFLETGILGIVSIGADLDDVLSSFGCPDGYISLTEFESSYKKAKAKGTHNVFPVSYGILEILFEFETKKANFFKLYYDEYRQRKLPSYLDDGWVNQLDGLNLTAFARLLNQCGLGSKRVFNPLLDPYVATIWIPVSKIQVNFNLENEQDSLLVISKIDSQLASDLCTYNTCEDFT